MPALPKLVLAPNCKPLIDGRVGGADLDLRKGGGSEKIHSEILGRESLTGLRIGPQARKASALLPRQSRSQDDGVVDGCDLAAGRKCCGNPRAEPTEPNGLVVGLS